MTDFFTGSEGGHYVRKKNAGPGHSLELRAEAFNLLNHFNWGNPGTNLGAGTFGRIQTQAGAPASSSSG